MKNLKYRGNYFPQVVINLNSAGGGVGGGGGDVWVVWVF